MSQMTQVNVINAGYIVKITITVSLRKIVFSYHILKQS